MSQLPGRLGRRLGLRQRPLGKISSLNACILLGASIVFAFVAGSDFSQAPRLLLLLPATTT